MTPLQRCMTTELSSQAIHLWWGCSDDSQPSGSQWQVLSSDEQERAGRFIRDRDRNRYVFVRSTLRHLLSRYTKIPAQDIRFCYGSKGKPALEVNGVDEPLEFNVSHSQNLVLCGLSRQAIGVDVEYIQSGVQVLRLAKRFFTPREYAALHALPTDEQRRFFFRLWTRKESCIKATGESLFEQIGQLEVPCKLQGEAQWMTLGHHPLRVQDIRLHPHYCAAIASQVEDPQLSCFELELNSKPWEA